MAHRDQFQHKFYYGIGCDNPLSKPGALALHTWATDTVTRDIEVKCGVDRPDIGRIDELDCRKEFGAGGWTWVTIYDETNPELSSFKGPAP